MTCLQNSSIRDDISFLQVIRCLPNVSERETTVPNSEKCMVHTFPNEAEGLKNELSEKRKKAKTGRKMSL